MPHQSFFCGLKCTYLNKVEMDSKHRIGNNLNTKHESVAKAFPNVRILIFNLTILEINY